MRTTSRAQEVPDAHTSVACGGERGGGERRKKKVQRLLNKNGRPESALQLRGENRATTAAQTDMRGTDGKGKTGTWSVRGRGDEEGV